MSAAATSSARIQGRNLPQLLSDAQQAAQRLSVATRSWPAFMPNQAALDEVANTLEGMRRTVCELQPHCATPTRSV